METNSETKESSKTKNDHTPETFSGTTVNSDMIKCKYCKQNVQRDSLNEHEKQCDKLDRPRVQTSNLTPKELLAEDKLKDMATKPQEQQHTKEKGLRELQKAMEQKLFWMTIIFPIAVAVLIMMVIGLGRQQIVTSQMITNMINKTVPEFERQLDQLANTTVPEFERQLDQLANTTVPEFERQLEKLENTRQMLTITQYLIEQKLGRFEKLLCPGYNANWLASSCKEILDCNPSSSSGYYWMASADGKPTHMFCSMDSVCGGLEGVWMRIAKLDMRNNSSPCPSTMTKKVHNDKTLCGKHISKQGTTISGGDCSHVVFKTNNVKYKQVCGKIIAYQLGSTDAFKRYDQYNNIVPKEIHENYLDGVSLTHGSNPRKHIWSFAAALDEVATIRNSNCKCTKSTTAADAISPPSFVGDDYFCDTGSANKYADGQFYGGNPLWDGAGCGSENACCSKQNKSPWFFKKLQSSTSEDIEMRVCCDAGPTYEDVLIEQIEIYIK